MEFSCNFPPHTELPRRGGLQTRCSELCREGAWPPETESVVMRVTLHLPHQPSITHRNKTASVVINMANFLANYRLTRTNNCLIIILARLSAPDWTRASCDLDPGLSLVESDHTCSRAALFIRNWEISFQFDCWLVLTVLYGELLSPFSHCWFLQDSLGALIVLLLE